jgi:hypothetical protein
MTLYKKCWVIMTSYKKCFLLLADFRSFSTISMLKSSSLVIVIMISSLFIPSSARGIGLRKNKTYLAREMPVKRLQITLKRYPVLIILKGS